MKHETREAVFEVLDAEGRTETYNVSDVINDMTYRMTQQRRQRILMVDGPGFYIICSFVGGTENIVQQSLFVFISGYTKIKMRCVLCLCGGMTNTTHKW